MVLILISIIILILILIWYFYYNERFISFMQNELSEYGPTPWVILVKYTYKNLTVMEIFLDKTYKLYSEDGLVREGKMSDEYWKLVLELNNHVIINNNDEKYGKSGKYIVLNGKKINIENNSPFLKLFELMIYSDISR